MAFDASQRKAFTRLIKALALDFGFTENAITAEIGDMFGAATDATGAGSSADTSAGAGNAGKVLLLDAGGKADGVDLSAPTGSASIARAGYVAYPGPAAVQTTAGACTIVSDVAITAVALTLALQPGVPCKLNVIKTDADSSYAATLTLIGVGPGGEALNEVVALLAVDGSHTYTTVNAYAKITSATVSALSGNTGADHIAIGFTAALGLPIPQGATSVVVYKVAHDATLIATPIDEAVGTVDATARTVIPTTSPDGTKGFFIWFSYAQTHTHTLN